MKGRERRFTALSAPTNRGDQQQHRTSNRRWRCDKWKITYDIAHSIPGHPEIHNCFTDTWTENSDAARTQQPAKTQLPESSPWTGQQRYVV